MYKGDKALCPVENYLVQRVLTSFNVDMGHDDYGLSVGINFNEKGIEVVYGTRVFVCSNLNIYGDFRLRTYGQNKYDYVHTVELLEYWAENSNKKFDNDIRIIETLQKNTLDRHGYHEMLGMLIGKAGLAVNNRSVETPLNVTQTLRLIEESNKSDTNPMPDGFLEGHSEISLWDMTQWGTAILKPDSNDVMSVYSHNHKFNEFVLNQCPDNTLVTEL
jgi:hypothetical protein